MSELHGPAKFAYKEFVGYENGVKAERERILGVVHAKLAEYHDANEAEITDAERALEWLVRIIAGTDEQES